MFGGGIAVRAKVLSLEGVKVVNLGDYDLNKEIAVYYRFKGVSYTRKIGVNITDESD